MYILKNSCVVIMLGIVASGNVFAQAQTDKERAAQQAIKAVHARDLPEATLPCTPEESSWWNEVRAVAKVINPARPNKPETEKLTRLIKKAIEQAYQIPVPDRYATVLWRAAPQYTERARHKKINGSVAMAVELLPDGTVGEVKIAQSLDPGLDQMAIETTRKLVFLPAIKNRKFVSIWMPMTMSFNIYETYHR